jgi:hypothetical protein
MGKLLDFTAVNDEANSINCHTGFCSITLRSVDYLRIHCNRSLTHMLELMMHLRTPSGAT